MRRGIQQLDLVGIVVHQMPERAPEIRIALFAETDDIGRHRHDAVLAQQLDRLLVFAHGRALADGGERGVAVAFDAEQKADHAGLAVQMQDVAVAHDVARARGADQQQRHVLGDQRVQKRQPHAA